MSMERKWIENNREDFERDVLREFCRASDMLFSQFERLAASGTISFPVLREMVGEPLNKGMLWRLKDKSHHLFRQDSGTDQVGVLLD
ncbi:hypothetical protein LJC46_04580 [Desulfovibrio sp. OttesenSCG-928-G15]|nr:hypothetical protein [Desulfovibrio sp. OttesenSCG-928-G15]